MRKILLILLVCVLANATAFAEKETNTITVLTAEERTDIVEVRELNLREKLIAKLEDAHRRGEFLDISVQDIENLPMAQLKAIERAEETIERGEEMLQNDFPDAPKSETNYVEAAPHDDRVFQNVIEKIKENKGFLGGFAVFSALSTYGYVRYGRKMLMEESDEEYEKREERTKKAIRANIYPKINKIDIYSDYTAEEMTGADVVKTLSEPVVFTPSETQYKETIQLACRVGEGAMNAVKKDVVETMKEVNQRIRNGEQIPAQDLRNFYILSQQILSAKTNNACVETNLQEIKEQEWKMFEQTNKQIKNILAERERRGIV